MPRVTVFAVLILVVTTCCCLGQLDHMEELPVRPARECSECLCLGKQGKCVNLGHPIPSVEVWDDVRGLSTAAALRSPAEIQEDLPEGCTLDTDAMDENVVAKVKCPPHGPPDKGNGDCCCEARQSVSCPKWINCGGEMVQIVSGVADIPGGPLYQCWPLIYCGEPRQCESKNCQPIMEKRPVLVVLTNGKWGWRMCPLQTGCKCMGVLNDGVPYGYHCRPVIG